MNFSPSSFFWSLVEILLIVVLLKLVGHPVTVK